MIIQLSDEELSEAVLDYFNKYRAYDAPEIFINYCTISDGGTVEADISEIEE